MANFQVNKTYQEINDNIKKGQAVVVTAEEIIDLVRRKGEAEAARSVDVVTTGTFSPMCSSGAFLNFGHSKPPIKASRVWLNNVPAYAGLAAVDVYLGATEPNKRLERDITLKQMVNAILCNPRNCYQNYNVAVNLSNRTIYTYMGPLRPKGGNANFCTAGELSPLFNDPYYRTIGIGSRIFLGGGVGYVVFPGTQHNPGKPRSDNGIPLGPAGTLMVMGDLKKMSPRFLVGVSLLGVGLGVPIPMLNEEIAHFCGVRDEELLAPIVDYGSDYPTGSGRVLGHVSYAQLKSGSFTLDGKEIPAVPLSSLVRAREIAKLLKEWLVSGKFLLGEPVEPLPTAEDVHCVRTASRDS
jgi:uncharacterized protein (DUF39 family)